MVWHFLMGFSASTKKGLQASAHLMCCGLFISAGFFSSQLGAEEVELNAAEITRRLNAQAEIQARRAAEQRQRAGAETRSPTRAEILE